MSVVLDLKVLLKRVTVPLDGLSIVPMMFSRDDLPPPEVPRIQTNSPCFMVADTPLTAVTPSMPMR